MSKRMWLLLMVLLLLLAACSTAEEPAEDEAAPAATEAPTEAPASADEEEAQAETDVSAEMFVIGMMKIVSHPALDAEQQGVKEQLAAAGFIEGENLTILEGNAEGDIATLSTIAQQFLDEGVDLVVATSTPALQAIYNATKDLDNPPPIVFNAVTSPYAAGIAVAPDDHPEWVIGIQALGPIAEALGLIPQMMPEVETVGYLYNPAEANSVVNTEIAEPAAAELGLNFEIVTVSNSNEVQAAAEALVSRGVEAFFVSTDSTVVTGLEALVKVANENDIPLFANDPASAERGAAVALGLDYYVDGLESGELVVAVLKGELDIPSTTIRAQDAGSLAVNLGAAAEQGLEIPQSYIDQAAVIFGDGEEAAMAETDVSAETFVIGMMKIVSHPALDAEQQGVKEQLAAAGFIEGENLTILEGNAEGDIATLSTIAQQFLDEGVDLVVATSTPALQAIYNATKDLDNPPPIVFNAVTSPYAAGIAAAPDDHPEWVIGIQALGPIAEALGLIPEMMPEVETVGYLYNPAEANSVVNTEIAEPAAAELGLNFEIVTVSNSNEVQAAAEALVSRGVEAFFVSTDSTVVTGLEALVKVANENDIPLFANDPASAERGAAVALGLDYYVDGLESGELVVAVLKGELDIPSTTIRAQDAGSLAVNLGAAAEQGLEIPQSYIDQAATIFE